MILGTILGAKIGEKTKEKSMRNWLAFWRVLGCSCGRPGSSKLGRSGRARGLGKGRVGVSSQSLIDLKS